MENREKVKNPRLSVNRDEIPIFGCGLFLGFSLFISFYSSALKRIYAHGEQNFRRLHAPEYAPELLCFFSSYKTQVEFYSIFIIFTK